MASFENDVVVAKNLNFDQAAAKPHLGIINAAGKLPIGTGNTAPTPEILGGVMTSPDNSITFGYSSPNITAVVAGGSTVGKTITGNTGGALNPTAGNWNILGPNSAITGYSPYVTGSVSTETINMPGTVKWVVNATANLGTHTTIQAAITAASSGDDVFITPGTYTENLTLKAGVNLTGYGCDSSQNGTGKVIISGTATFTGAGTVSMSGLQLQTNSAAFLAVTGSSASIVNLTNCYLNCTNGTGITFSSSSASSAINIQNCLGDLGTTGIALFAHSSSGVLTIQWSNFTNSGSSTTANTISAGNLTCRYCRFENPITSSSTAACGLNQSIVNCSSTNATAFTSGGSGTHIAELCNFHSGTASAVSISNTLTMTLTNIDSTNANAITGAGTIKIAGVAFSNSSSTINTTTITLQVINGGEYSGRTTNTVPSAGKIGEQAFAQRTLASASSLTNNTGLSLTSVSLTAGIWDVSCTGCMRGNNAGTQWGISLNSVDNTVSTNYGYTYIFTPTTSTTATDICLTIPRVRLSLASTTTYYLVALALFSGGSPTAYGTINATRVA